MSPNDQPPEAAIRPGEIAVTPPPPTDAGLIFIGRIRTPWATRQDTPKQGRQDGPLCRIEIFDPWARGLAGLNQYTQIEVIYWLHLSRRDLILQSPGHTGAIRGTFSLRSPARPNPLGSSMVRLAGIEANILSVHGLDCLDGTPLIDIKPDRCGYSVQPSVVSGR